MCVSHSCLPPHWHQERKQGSQGTLTTCMQQTVVPKNCHSQQSGGPLNYFPISQRWLALWGLGTWATA